MKQFTLPSGTVLIKCTHRDTEYVKLPQNGGDIQLPFDEEGVVVSTITYTVDYIIEYDESNYITDAGGEHYPQLVGGRPKDRGGR